MTEGLDNLEFLPRRAFAIMTKVPPGQKISPQRLRDAADFSLEDFKSIKAAVPGPQQALNFCGAKLVMLTGLAVITENLGISHAVTSNGGTLVVAPLSERRILPHPAFYRECVKASFDELRDAAAAGQPRVSRAQTGRQTASPKKTGGQTTSPHKGNQPATEKFAMNSHSPVFR